MASSTTSTRSSDDNFRTGSVVSERYACYWLESCRGQHDLYQCTYWEKELRGKYAYYYSPTGDYRDFRSHRSNDNLRYNFTGCKRVHLLIYTIRLNGEKEILFGLLHPELMDGEYKKPLLSFPLSNPRKRQEYGIPVAQRALKRITDQTENFRQGLKSHFVFQHSNAIYPLYLTIKQADMLTRSFTANEDFSSLHWFPLTTVLERLARWLDDPNNKQTKTSLTREEFIEPEGIHLGEYELRPVTAASLMYIREHVPDGFDTFLPM